MAEEKKQPTPNPASGVSTQPLQVKITRDDGSKKHSGKFGGSSR